MGQRQQAIHRLAQEIVEPRNNHLSQIILDSSGLKSTLRANQRIDKQERLGDLHSKSAESAEAYQPQLGIFERHGVLRPPAHIGEDLEVHKADLGAERTGEAPRQSQHFGENGKVTRREGMTTGTQDIEPFAIAEEDGGLIVARTPQERDELAPDCRAR